MKKFLLLIIGITLFVYSVDNCKSDIQCPIDGNNTEQRMTSGEAVEKECDNCNGTGKVPEGADYLLEYGSTRCWEEGSPNHVCHKILCPRCMRAHCEALDLHKKCPVCKGKGTVELPKWMQ